MAESFDRSHWTSMAMRDVSFAAIGGALFGAVPAMWELGPVHPNKPAVPFKVSNFVYSMGNCSVSFIIYHYIDLYSFLCIYNTATLLGYVRSILHWCNSGRIIS